MAYSDGRYEGKFFVLASKLNGLVLDIEANNRNPGTHVKMWHAKPLGDNDNQVWYEDHATGTIRSALNDFCLDVQGDCLVVNPHSYYNTNQQWTLSGDRIVNRHNSNLVLDVANVDTRPGARVCSWQYNGGNQQLWTPRYMMPRFFVIRSRLCNKVLDIEAGNTNPGANVIIYDYNGGQNQLFYEDRSGVIRAKINNFAIDDSGHHLRLNPYNPGNPGQQWVISGDSICLRHNPQRVVDIEAGSTWNGTKLVAFQRHGQTNQSFTIQYV